MGPAHEYSNVLNRQESFRPQNAGVSNGSSPSGSSTSGGFANMQSPAVRGSYSAPAHSHQFALSDQQSEWFNDHPLNGATIEEHPEYMTTQQPAGPAAHLVPLPHHQPSQTPSAVNSFDEFSHHHPHHHQGIVASHLNHLHRPEPILINHHSSSVVDHS